MYNNTIFISPSRPLHTDQNSTATRFIHFPDLWGKKSGEKSPDLKTEEQTDIGTAQDIVKTTRVNTQKLDQLVQSCQKVLFSARAVFPFDFFPDHISIEPSQVNIATKTFFATYHVRSIPIKNVADVFLQTSLFFASLKIIDSSYIENSVSVDHLKKNDASKARRIIQGLAVAMKAGIDLSRFNPHELTLKAEQLGDAREVDVL